ncbi:Uncharacterised protein [Pseudomonas aeruginosa]|nr:Uncharacterised protein [Pseudomonas aeruginosa]
MKPRRSGVVTVAGSGASSLLRRGRSAGARATARCRCPRTPPTPGTVRTGSSPVGAAAGRRFRQAPCSARRAWMSARVSLCREAIDIGWVWYGRSATGRRRARRAGVRRRPLRMICWLLSRQYSTPRPRGSAPVRGPFWLSAWVANTTPRSPQLGDHHDPRRRPALPVDRGQGQCPRLAHAIAAGAFQPVCAAPPWGSPAAPRTPGKGLRWSR